MELFHITLTSANYVRWSTDPKELWKNTWFQNTEYIEKLGIQLEVQFWLYLLDNI